MNSVLHVEYDSSFAPLTQANVQAVANKMRDTWVAQMMPQQTSQLTLDTVTATDLDTLTGNQAVASSGAVGGDASPAAGASLCMLVQLRTPIRGRSYRGRCYIPGIGQSERATPQTWNAAFAETCEDNFENMQADLIGMGAPTPGGFCVVSYYSGTDKTIPGKRPKPIRRTVPIATVCTFFVGNQRIASQRRRNQ
jgi:hypothetical protein